MEKWLLEDFGVVFFLFIDKVINYVNVFLKVYSGNVYKDIFKD